MIAEADEAPRLLALVVGIDAYPFLVANPLRGCGNDARRMAALLGERFGARITTLLDEQATRGAILETLAGLLDEARDGDRIVVHFSGHGSRIRTHDGARIETLVPHDSGRGEHPNRDILDREVEAWLRALRRTTTSTALIFDSCHAGGMTRDLEAAFRSVEADERPEAAAGKDAFRYEGGTRRGAGADGPSGWISPADGYTLIAACRADERASEWRDPETGLVHGILTRFLAEELARVGPGHSYRDLFEPVARRVTGRFREQRPQLEGAWDREVFGARELRQARYVSLQRREGEEAWLEAGAAHGLVLGSEWQVHAAGGKDGIGEEVLGRLRLVEIGAVRTRAEVVEEAGRRAVAAGDRAVEAARPAGAGRLVVALGPSCDALRPALERSPWLRPTAEPDEGEVLVRRLEARRRAAGGEPRARLGARDRPAWAVTDRAGGLLMPPLLASGEGSGDLLRSNLEVWARHRALGELRNAGDSDFLRAGLEIELLRGRGGGAWEPAPPRPDGCAGYTEGDSLGLRLRHSHLRELHFGVLDLGLTGAVHLLHPVRGAIEPLPPGRWLEIGLGGADRIELFVPSALPYAGERFDGGRESLLFIATEEPTDLGALQQDGMAEGPAGRRRSTPPVGPGVARRLDDLQGLLATSEAVAGRRDARPAGRPPRPGRWAAHQRSIWLARNGAGSGR